MRNPSGSIARSLATAAAVLALGGCDLAPPVIEAGAPAPAYAGPRLDGERLSLTELRGEVVLLNVWATWCYPCRKEMPSFEALHREFADQGLRVVAVSIDAPGARREIESFLDEHGISFTIVHDGEQEITRRYQTLGVPETFLIGRDGRLLRRWTGRVDGHSESVRGPIREALAG